MPRFDYDPAASAMAGGGSFCQTIRLLEANQLLGMARWAANSDGVIQLLEITVEPPHRRKGLGGQLMREVHAQASTHFRLRKGRLRRTWAAVEQKTHILGRAFLTAHGFHHISTVDNLLKDQDLLIYIRTFD